MKAPFEPRLQVAPLAVLLFLTACSSGPAAMTKGPTGDAQGTPLTTPAPGGNQGGAGFASVVIGGDVITLSEAEACSATAQAVVVSIRSRDGSVHLTVQGGGGNNPIRLTGYEGATWGAGGLSNDDATVVQFSGLGAGSASWTGQLTNTTTDEQRLATLTINC